jgi:hypothetical protein
MYAIDSWAVPLLTTSHGVIGRAWASVNGSPFTVPMKLRAGGTVTLDGTAAVRRVLDCEVAADIESATVSPLITELAVEYGVIVGRRQSWTPVGTFVITSAKESTTPGVVKIKGEDRWRRIQEARFDPAVTTSGNTASAIATLAAGADPRIAVTDLTGSTATHPATRWDRDRDKAILELCKSIDAQLYFTPSGAAILAPHPALPDAADPGVIDVGRGTGGSKVSSARTLDREPIFTAATVTGEPLDGGPPVYATSRDTDPASPTRHGGPFGQKTNFYHNPLIRTTVAAQSVADSRRARLTGIAWAIDLTMLPHPGLEYGDPLRVEVAPGQWQTHMLEGYPLPLGPGTVAVKTRTTALAVASEP